VPPVCSYRVSRVGSVILYGPTVGLNIEAGACMATSGGGENDGKERALAKRHRSHYW